MPIKMTKNGWKIDVTRNGQRFRKLITSSRSDAEHAEREAIKALSNGKPLNVLSKPSGISMKNLYKLTHTLRWSQHKSNSQSRTGANLLDLMGCSDRLASHFLSQKSINNIEVCMIEKGLSHATMDKYKSALRIMCSVALDNGYIDEEPKIKLSGKSNRREKFLTHKDEDKFLLAMLDKGFHELYDASIVAIDTGSRASELLKLKREDYHEKTIIFIDTKNSDSRSIPLTNRANEIITNRLNNDKLFNLTYEQIKYQWRVIRESLGYDKQYCFHVCRHTFTTRLLMKRHPTPMVALLTGHKSLSSLNVYAHANTEHLREMIDTLN